jgi:hypothetical protein
MFVLHRLLAYLTNHGPSHQCQNFASNLLLAFTLFPMPSKPCRGYTQVLLVIHWDPAPQSESGNGFWAIGRQPLKAWALESEQ